MSLLQFKVLPVFAEYLLKNKIVEFTRHQLNLAFEVDLPILKKYDLSIYTKEQLFDMSLLSYTEFLKAAADNKLQQYIDKAIKTWETNQLPEIESDQLVVEDITLATYIRKRGLLHFIQLFTTDVNKSIELINEIDEYCLEVSSRSFHTYISIHGRKIDEINEALVEQESELLKAQEIAGLGSFEWDLTGAGKSKYTPQIFKIFEMEDTSALDDFMKYVHPADREKLSTSIAKAMEGKQDYECEYRYRKNGKEKVLWSKGIVSFNENKPFVMKGTVMDITDRHYILKHLERNQELYKQAQKLTHIGNWTWDLKTGHIEYSDELYRIYGIELNEKVTFDYGISFIHPDDKELVLKWVDYSIKMKKPHSLDFRIIRRDGDIRVIRRNAEVLLDEMGVPYKLVGTGQDITKEVQLNKEIREREEKLAELNLSLEQKNRELEKSNKELTSFSYVASHDLQEPIRKIKTFSNLIVEKEKNISEEGLQWFNRIVVNVGRMQKLIEDLLSFSRTQINESVYETVDLNLVIAEIKNFYGESIKDERLIIKNEELPVINAVPFQIQQLMENIVSNSIKYCKPDIKCIITIASERINGKNLPFYNVWENKEYFKISVSDNGIGFDEKYAEKIFEIFQRLHGKNEYSGTGIGLSICKKIVENHRGFICARGALDVGSTFDIYLPA